MRAYKVKREVWDFKEVRETLGVSALDLKRMVMSGEIRPVTLFSRPLCPLTVVDGELVEGEEMPVRAWLWVVPEHAERFDNFNCLYSVWRDGPEHDDASRYFKIPGDPMTLDELLKFAVVLDEDVQELIDCQRRDPERELSTREEKTRDKLIAAFAAERFKWQGGPLDFKGLTDFCDGANAIELGVSYNTAKAHIELAWKLANPRSLQGKPALSVVGEN